MPKQLLGSVIKEVFFQHNFTFALVILRKIIFAGAKCILKDAKRTKFIFAPGFFVALHCN